jgi:hypothetical protein
MRVLGVVASTRLGHPPTLERLTCVLARAYKIAAGLSKAHMPAKKGKMVSLPLFPACLGHAFVAGTSGTGPCSSSPEFLRYLCFIRVLTFMHCSIFFSRRLCPCPPQPRGLQGADPNSARARLPAHLHRTECHAGKQWVNWESVFG